MIGILILFGVFVWLLLGQRWHALYKLIVIGLCIAGYIYFLHLQGADKYEIWEILFSLKTK